MIQAYRLALFLFILNLSLMLLAQIPLFGSAFSGETFTTNMSSENFTYTFNSSTNSYYIAYDSDLIDSANFSGYQASGVDEIGLLEILIMFGTAIFNSTAFLPFYLNNVLSAVLPDDLRYAIVTFITGPVWFVYGAGIFQIVRGLIFEE